MYSLSPFQWNHYLTKPPVISSYSKTKCSKKTRGWPRKPGYKWADLFQSTSYRLNIISLAYLWVKNIHYFVWHIFHSVLPREPTWPVALFFFFFLLPPIVPDFSSTWLDGRESHFAIISCSGAHIPPGIREGKKPLRGDFPFLAKLSCCGLRG